MKSRIEVGSRAVFLALFATLFSTALSAQTYSYPTSWACGGTIRARVVSAAGNAISIAVQKSTNCTTSVPFQPPGGSNTAYIRSGSATGAIVGSKSYFSGDPEVVISVPGFTSGSRSFVATIDAYSTPAMTVTVTMPDEVVSYQSFVTNPAAGAAMALGGQVLNVGNATAGASTAVFAYSTSPSMTGSTKIGSPMSVGALAPNGSSPLLQTTWTVPTALAGTTIYIAMLADSNGNVAESNEANNFFTPAREVHIAGTPVAGPLLEIQIGAVAWLHVQLGPNQFRRMTPAELRSMLSTFVAEVGNGMTTLTGNGRKVTLVISLEIPWNETEPTQGNYDFGAFVDVARACTDQKIRFSPQLSPHYLPDWVKKAYAADALPGRFLPLRPTSLAWEPNNGPAVRWIRAAISALANDTNGTNHFAFGGPIDTVLVGNEIQFEKSPAAASPAAAATRATQLATMIVGLLNAAKDQLDHVGGQNIAVASKLYPYMFPGGPANPLESSYTDASVKTIVANFRGYVAFDSYSKTPSGPPCTDHSWVVGQDIDAAARYAQAKPLFMAEWDYDRGNCTASMPAQVIRDTVAAGINKGVRVFTFFALNPGDAHTMGAEQKSGLRQAFYATVGK